MIGPDKKIKLILVYPMTTGRNFDEVLRVIDSLQLTANHKVATPANWQQGDDVIIAGSVSDDARQGDLPGRLGVAEALHPDRAAAALTRFLRLRAAPGRVGVPCGEARSVPHAGPDSVRCCGERSAGCRRLRRPR